MTKKELIDNTPNKVLKQAIIEHYKNKKSDAETIREFVNMQKGETETMEQKYYYAAIDPEHITYMSFEPENCKVKDLVNSNYIKLADGFGRCVAKLNIKYAFFKAGHLIIRFREDMKLSYFDTEEHTTITEPVSKWAYAMDVTLYESIKELEDDLSL